MKEQDLMVGMSRIILNNLLAFLDVWLRCSRHTRWSSVVLYMRGCRSLQSPLHGGERRARQPGHCCVYRVSHGDQRG